MPDVVEELPPEVPVVFGFRTWPCMFAKLVKAVRPGVVQVITVRPREWRPGDLIRFQEWRPDTDTFSGEELLLRVARVRRVTLYWQPVHDVELVPCD